MSNESETLRNISQALNLLHTAAPSSSAWAEAHGYLQAVQPRLELAFHLIDARRVQDDSMRLFGLGICKKCLLDSWGHYATLTAAGPQIIIDALLDVVFNVFYTNFRF